MSLDFDVFHWKIIFLNQHPGAWPRPNQFVGGEDGFGWRQSVGGFGHSNANLDVKNVSN